MEKKKPNDAERYEAMRRRCLRETPYTMSQDTRYTACVGSNGHYGQDTICDGFSDAVETLVRSLGTYDNFADSLVYPILYCVRHSIELYLKDIYNSVQFIYGAKTHRDTFVKRQKLLKISFRVSQRLEDCKDQLSPRCLDRLDTENEAVLRKRLETLEEHQKAIDTQIDELYDQCFKEPEFDIYTHDLKSLKDEILKTYRQADERIPKMFDPVLQYLVHYEWIDPRGDAFRYLLSREGDPHLEGKRISHVNLLTVAFQHEEISQIFKGIQMSLYYLRKEYGTGTFTKDLSREQLEEISKLLPKPGGFDDKIKETKEIIKKQYKIGSNKFNEALAIIRRHREFSYNMGKEIIFPGLSESVLRIFGECAKDERDWETAAKDISYNELCLLYVFLDISGWKYEDKSLTYYSEDLNHLYQKAKRDRRINPHDINPRNDILHVLEGMMKCGQKTYADILKAYA